MVASISEQQAGAFAILRRSQRETDLIPEDRWESYRRGALRTSGLIPALARRAGTPLGNVWVIPGEKGICLSLANSPPPCSLDGGGLTCNTTEAALKGLLITWGPSPSGRGQSVQGLVPDHIAAVTLIATDGSAVTPQISENTYGASLNDALCRVCVDGRTVLRLGVQA